MYQLDWDREKKYMELGKPYWKYRNLPMVVDFLFLFLLDKADLIVVPYKEQSVCLPFTNLHQRKGPYLIRTHEQTPNNQNCKGSDHASFVCSIIFLANILLYTGNQKNRTILFCSLLGWKGAKILCKIKPLNKWE